MSKKLTELAAAEDTLNRRIEELEEQLLEHDEEMAKEEKTAIRSLAARLLNDPTAKLIRKPRPALEDLQAELEAMRAARERLRKQREAEEARLEAEAILAAIPRHRTAVVEVVKAAIELAKRLADERAIRAGVGEHHSLRPMPLPAVHLRLHDENSSLACYIREAVQYGLLRGDEDFLTEINWKLGSSSHTHAAPVRSGGISVPVFGDFR